jgi:hypothetical protein
MNAFVGNNSKNSHTMRSAYESVDKSVDNAQHEAEREAIKSQIEEIINTSLTAEQKAAYKQAPAYLVHEESHPYSFYQREKGNLTAAARRLCQYWNMRFCLFHERAFMPMHDLSGEGALTVDDMDYMKGATPHAMQLPKDTKGRSVLFIDAKTDKVLKGYTNKTVNNDDIMRRQRSEFYYLCYLAAQNPLSSDHPTGAVLLLFRSSQRHTGKHVHAGRDHNGSFASINASMNVSPAVFSTQFTMCHTPKSKSASKSTATAATSSSAASAAVVSRPAASASM